MCAISNRWIAALEFQWTGVNAVPGSPATATGYVVQLTVYEIRTDAGSGLDIFYTAYTQTLDTYTTTINGTTFYNESISKVGTVCTDGKYIYASYEDKTWVLEEDDANFTTPILTSIIHTSGATYPKSYDSKVVGKSLYLISGGNAGSGVSDKQYTSTNTYLKKIDISDALSPVVEWSIETGHAGTKFEIVGNKAYIAHQFQYVTGSPNLGIETIELDGIITDHANIGSLKSTDIHSTGEINAARNVNVGRSISVGESALVQGTLGVEGIVDVGDSMRIGRGLNIGTSVISSLDINNGKINLSTEAAPYLSRIDVRDELNNDRINLISSNFQSYISLFDGSGNRMVHISQSSGPYAVIALGENDPAFDGDGHYILAANPNQKLLFGSLVNPAGSGGINYELVLHNAGSSLPSPLTSDNGLQVSNSLWVGGNLRANGTVSVGTVAGTGAALYRNTSTGLLAPSVSDERLKQNIEQIEGALDKVLNMRGVYFNWKDADDFSSDDDSRQIGMIAQEVEEILPEAVILNGVRDYKTIRYSEMIAVLVEAIKEQQEQIEIMKDEIAVLKGTSPEGY